MDAPPPLPPPGSSRRHIWPTIALAITIMGSVIATYLVVARPVQFIKVATRSMSPALEFGDYVLVEGISYKSNGPRRGDIVTFTTDKISGRDGLYVMRVAGLPGETLRLDDGVLYVNGTPAPLRNKAGEITYLSFVGQQYLRNAQDAVTVPPHSYFVLGDNSAHCKDSRYWGFVPEKSVQGKVYARFPKGTGSMDRI